MAAASIIPGDREAKSLLNAEIVIHDSQFVDEVLSGRQGLLLIGLQACVGDARYIHLDRLASRHHGRRAVLIGPFQFNLPVAILYVERSDDGIGFLVDRYVETELRLWP